MHDTIGRPHLWNHLNKTRMPTHLINVIRQMYNGDVYDLTKNTSTGYSAVPLRGVKQGFPPSPPLFSLFINDVDDDFGSGLVGVGMLESHTD